MARLLRHPSLIGISAFLLFVVNFATRYPGEGNHDSQRQYLEAVSGVYTDWHPPIMAWWWSVLRFLGDGKGPMFGFQVGLYWFAIGIIAVALARLARPFSAWAVVAVGSLPLFLMLNICLHKDIGMAVALLSSVAIIFWYRSQGDKVPLAALAVSVLLLFYGAMIRNNAVFAVGPLLLYILAWRGLAKFWRVILLSLMIALVLIPASMVFNNYILGAKKTGAIRSLQLFDLTGIAFQSGEPVSLGPDRFMPVEEVRRCYSPIMWDTLGPSGKCPYFFERLAFRQPIAHAPFNELTQGGEFNPDLSRLWIEAIVTHPLAYVEHRLLHFNAFSYFLVPSHVTELIRPTNIGVKHTSKALKEAMDVLRYGILFAPMLWILIGVWELAIKPREDTLEQNSEAYRFGIILILSALLYFFSFLPFGVATDQRYYFYSLLAIMLGTVVSWPMNWRYLKEKNVIKWVWACAAFGILLAMFIARASDSTALVNPDYISMPKVDYGNVINGQS